MTFSSTNPWPEVATRENPPYLATCDRDIKLADFYSIRAELLPQPYLGNVTSAKVVCLLLNPGCSDTEDTIELDCQKLQQALRDNLKTTESRLIHLDDEFDWTSGGKWLRQKTQEFFQCGVTRDDLNRNFAIIEYFPYHSKTFNFKRGMPLKSQQFSFDLVRQAIKNNAIILMMRGEKYWLESVPELKAYQDSGNYITPHTPRNSALSKGNLGEAAFSRIVETLKS